MPNPFDPVETPRAHDFAETQIEPDFVLVAQPDGTLVNIDEYRMPCGHTETEHRAARQAAVDDTLTLVAAAMVLTGGNKDNLPQWLAAADALSLDGRVVLVQLTAQLVGEDEENQRLVINHLLGAGWVVEGFTLTGVFAGAHHDDRGRALLETILSNLDSDGIMALVRTAVSGAEARQMTAEDVRGLSAQWADRG